MTEITICDWCQREVMPDGPGIVRGVQLHRAQPVMGDTSVTYGEGLGVWLHEGCARDAPAFRYRLDR